MESDERRVILVKPGDVLLIGNIGSKFAPAALAEVIKALSELVGCPVAVFEEDIDLDAVTLPEPVTPPLDTDALPTEH